MVSDKYLFSFFLKYINVNFTLLLKRIIPKYRQWTDNGRSRKIKKKKQNARQNITCNHRIGSESNWIQICIANVLIEESRSDAESMVTGLASNRIVKRSEAETIPDVVRLIDSNSFDWFAIDWTATAVVRIDDGNWERTDSVFYLLRVPKWNEIIRRLKLELELKKN